MRLQATQALIDRFTRSFKALWAIPGPPGLTAATRSPLVGLAVSGGVDSMALVALCRHFRDHVDSKINFKAFIVDHGLRHKSAEEAAQVCEDVYNLGIEAEVLKVRVPIGEDGGVETVARNRRYGALEVAFRKGGISVGLTGHHQDDAVETFFLRIAQNSSGIHLASLGAFVPNTGLKHGCVASGAIDSERFVLDEYEQQCGWPMRPQWVSGDFRIEYGGSMLMRPLLAFRKQELHMICKALRVPYVEDHTNSDPTLTPRNAIRQLLRDPSQLPQALRHQAVIDRLIRLAAQRARQTSICARLLEACEPKRLDLRTGILKIRLPGTFKELKQLAKLDTQISSSEDDNLARQLIMACTTFIRPAWAIRSPRSSDLLPDLFPDLNGTRNDQRRSSFSAYELIWKQQKDVNNHKTSTVMPSLQADPVYIVRRSNPSRQNRQRRAIAIALSDRFRRAGTGRADQKGEENREGWLWTRWFLFDGTWWIRLKLDPRRTSSAFNLRYFEPEDGRRDEKLQRQLDEVAPADARYTLPAIVYDGKVVALPTIERSSPQAEGLGIRWEVRYANFPSGPKDLAMRRFQVLRDMFLEGTGERSTLGSVVDSEI